MVEHRFKIGPAVYLHPKKSRLAFRAPVGPYQIIERFPATGAEFKYAIKSAHEDNERVAKESELTRLENRVPLMRRRREI
jgi:hypothetical protein